MGLEVGSDESAPAARGCRRRAGVRNPSRWVTVFRAAGLISERMGQDPRAVGARWVSVRAHAIAGYAIADLEREIYAIADLERELREGVIISTNRADRSEKSSLSHAIAVMQSPTWREKG